MRTIYFMDTYMPISKDKSKIHSLEDLLENNIEKIDTSYSKAILNWAESEFKKIFDGKCFNLPNINISFFRSDYLTQEAFYMPQKNLIGLKLNSSDQGNESTLQLSTLHEITHVSTSDYYFVGVAVAEGIAAYVEDLFCEYYEISKYNSKDRDEGYIFANNLIKVIVSSVYKNNFLLFFDRIKKGNEKLFIRDIDNYLKENKVPFNARELLKLSSILFYAKNVPQSPFEVYRKNTEMENLRVEVLGCLSGESTVNTKISSLRESLQRIIKEPLDQDLSLDDKRTYLTTFDRVCGKKVVQKGIFALSEIDEIKQDVYECYENNNIKLHYDKEQEKI